MMSGPTVERIQRETAKHYGMGLEKLLGDSKAREHARPRQVAMFIARRLPVREWNKRLEPRHSYTTLARLFEGRDHTTILHGVRQIQKRIVTDLELRNDVATIINRLNWIEPVEPFYPQAAIANPWVR
jgi:chromosomal replication initiator protein